MVPIFRTNNLLDAGSRIVKEKHLKLMAVQKGIKFDGIAFNMSDFYPLISKNMPFDICYSLEMNEYKGNKNLQLKVRDIRQSL
jgi:single-stranded-DNA-specific exonuclease